MNSQPSPDAQPLGPDAWESAVQAAARAFPYPPAPDLAAGVRARLAGALGRRTGSAPRRRRSLAWVLAALALLLAGLFAVPQVRAAISEMLQIGGIRIFVAPSTPSPTPPARQTPAARTPAAQAGTAAASGATARAGGRAQPPGQALGTGPAATATPLASVLDLAGETSLVDARRRAGFTLRTPTYPPDLGAPGHVFVQDLGGPLVVLVWTVPGRPGSVRLSLHEFGAGTFADKFAPTVVQETTVNGVRAVWTEGPHLLVFRSGDLGPRELVRGHTLIWEQGGVTYRLETDQDLAEAIRIAGSLR